MPIQNPQTRKPGGQSPTRNQLLRPVILPLDLIGQQMPCDVFSARGTLMVKAGALISQRTHETLQPQRMFCEADQAHYLSGFDPAAELARISQSLSTISTRIACGGAVRSSELTLLARQVFDVWSLDADVCLGYARLAKFGRPSVRHSIHVALLAAELASAQGFKIDMIECVIGAALTMNLAKLDLHDAMFDLDRAPSLKMKQEMQTHPLQSALLLQRIGGLNAHWIDAVAAHHENIDGSGYPGRLKGLEIPLHARMLRIADTLAARLTGRKLRAPQHWNLQHARRDTQLWVAHIFGTEIRHLDNTLCHQLLRVLNRFSPGSLVRLNSNELAVVTRRLPDVAQVPHTVFAISDTRGNLLPAPSVRHLSLRHCEIRGYAHDALPRLPDVEWQKAWGYGL